MQSIVIATLIVGLFHFSEGKPCPEEFRPHPSRCDSYFHCVVLPTKTHVWVPSKCERGLIYEPNLKVCVLPGDDWECNLGDSTPKNPDENNIYGVDPLRFYPTETKQDPAQTQEVLLVEDSKSDSDESSDYIEVKSAEKTNNSELVASDRMDSDDSYESSGDGVEQENISGQVELKDGSVEIPRPSTNVDPKLSAHLQRLSQLIDGLKEKYQTKEDLNTDLRPDQLNAFLAHYNIKSQFDAINPASFDKQNIPQDGRIEPDILQQILNKQQELVLPNNTNAGQSFPGSYVRLGPMPKPSSLPDYNTQIVLKSSVPAKNYRKPDGYSNSQIVVNRPEGSVLFSLAGGGSGGYQQRPEHHEDTNIPHISEETLKTVLELSKQMVANQNMRQVFPNNGYYQPYLQPMYVPVPLIHPPNRNPYPDQNNYNQNNYDDNRYQLISSSSYPNKPEPNRKPTTIIQNSVIPVTISTASESGMIARPISEPSTEQPSYYKDDEKLDSYGNKISSYIEYPPFHSSSRPNFDYPTTTLRPSAQYDPPHVTPSSYFTPSPHLDNTNANDRFGTQQKYPALPYPSDPNPIQETPKPIQSSSQFFDQQASFNPANIRPQAPISVQSDQQYSSSNNNHLNYNPYAVVQMRPTSVKIRPNGVQSYGGSMAQPDDDTNSLESHFNYNQNQINSQIVSDLLAPNMNQQNTAPNQNHLVNLGGNFISYDVYKNQLLPALGGTAALRDKVEIINCVPGVRQPNTTDCTKYYVCSRKDGKVLSYSCPPYTGFNGQSHICDAKTYSFCSPQALYNRFTVSENRKLQMDAIQALQDAKKIRDEAIEAQNLAHLIRFETQKAINSTITPNHQGLQEPVVLMNYGQQSFPASSMSYTVSPNAPKPLITSPGGDPVQRKRKRYRCTDGAKIPDRKSVQNYYVCFKTSEGAMKRHKMTCTAGLIFCAKTALCTLPRKCNA